MAKGTVIKEKRSKPSYAIGILMPGGVKIVKTNLLLEELFDVYFQKLDTNLAAKEYTVDDAFLIYDKYEELYKKCKVSIQYKDSWDHVWKGKCAWPRKEKFIEYLKEKINDRTRVS